MQNNTFPGFVIQNTTIAVDFWPRQNQSSNITHYFLTHCHSDHTKNLDKTWNTSKIYCSKLSKKLLVELNEVCQEYIEELEINKTHVMRLDNEESFNVSLIDANHCPGAVMFLFEGYFGTVLATGDFRYSPSLLENISLQNIKIDICYLDNTYFNPKFHNFPTRDVALKQIINIIEQYRSPNVLFKILLKNLGKESLLVDLAEYFRIPIVLSSRRFERLTKILEIDKKYFSVNFSENSFIFVDDEPINRCKEILDDKQIIYIEPTGLKLGDSEARCDTNFFRVPYSDHSSYSEINYFVKKIRPKNIIPIVRKMLPNEIDTTDLNELQKYLNPEPLKDSRQKYLLLLQSCSSTLKSSRLNSINLGKTKTRSSTPITSRFVTLRNRKTKKLKKSIEFVDTPTKRNTRQSARQSPKTILMSSQNRSESFLKKASHPSKMTTNCLDPILEESRIMDEFDSNQCGVRQIKIEACDSRSHISSQKDKNKKASNKWKKIDENVELFVANDSDDSDSFEENKSEQIGDRTEKAVLKKLNPFVVLEKIDALKILNSKNKSINGEKEDILTSDESIYIENTIDEESNNNSWRIDSDFLNDSIEDSDNKNLSCKHFDEDKLFFDVISQNLKDALDFDPIEIGEQIRIHILDSFVF